ncbi:MAG: PadR family transcriptional regulator [Candidatus Obscuribacterales bacterium]|nr:PadR family transcriptional regulator [Candidatus Obscuribacterales bacterium]
MSLMHAILGFLHRHPQTGYALKNEQFDQSVAYFWPADQTQIYKTLDKLVDQEFATAAIEVQTDRPNRKVYSITKKGKQELKRWVSDEHEPLAYRDPLLVQLFFGDCVEPAAMIKVLEAAKVKHEEHLATLRSLDVPSLAKCADRETLHGRLTLELGLHSKQAYIDWLDQSIATIKKHEAKSNSSKKGKS